jgi:hypothetical protein
MHMKRQTKIIIALGVLVVAGFVLARLNLSSATVPTEFSDARFQGALIAQDIVNLSNQMSGDLAKVQEFDHNQSTTEAINLTTELLQRSQEVRTHAVELSQQLEKMTAALSGVKSQDARAVALESIADRLALINRLINYSDYLAQLMTTLRDRFLGTARPAGAPNVATIVNQINSEVTAINNFNRQAGQAMDRFDDILKK